MLRIADQWHGSDLGLQRQGNEDNYFVRAPLFVVADGMGGAQSGEVASEMAVEAFGGGHPGRRLAGRGAGPHHRDRQPAHPRALALGDPARRHGHDRHGRLRGRELGHGRARRRLALLPGPRRRARAPDRRPFARRRPRPPRQADRGAGRDAPAALGDHPRARAGAERDGRRRGVRRPGRRPVPGLLGRADRRWSARTSSSRC